MPHSSSRLMEEYLFCFQQTRFFHRLLAAYSSNHCYSSENHSNRFYSNSEEVDTSFYYFFLEVESFSKYSDFLCPLNMEYKVSDHYTNHQERELATYNVSRSPVYLSSIIHH